MSPNDPPTHYEPEGLDWFNRIGSSTLVARLLRLTRAPVWADALVAGRPYASPPELLDRSDVIVSELGEDQVDTALAGHPRIGERAAGLDPESAARSAREQAGMRTADPSQTSELAALNAAYEQRFGRIYLVAAAGLSAAELLDRARSRLNNDPVTELDVVRTELARITRRRLSGLLGIVG